VSSDRSGSATYYAGLLRTLQRLLALEAVQVEPAMQHAAQELANVLAADKIDVFVHDPQADALVAVATSDTPMGRRQHKLGLDRLEMQRGGRAIQVLQTGEPYLSNDVPQDCVELRAIVEDLGVRSAAYVPLYLVEQCRGVLLASSAEPDRFTREDLDFLAAVARWIGLVADRAKRVELLTRQAAEAGYGLAAGQRLNVLTPRQREIAALIARGYSNAEIARELVLVPGTVANHVEQILGRLRFRNRTEVAALVAETGLHRGQERAAGAQ
jgi:DNA-binding NarL/FixJ family response regulator